MTELVGIHGAPGPHEHCGPRDKENARNKGSLLTLAFCSRVAILFITQGFRMVHKSFVNMETFQCFGSRWAIIEALQVRAAASDLRGLWLRPGGDGSRNGGARHREAAKQWNKVPGSIGLCMFMWCLRFRQKIGGTEVLKTQKLAFWNRFQMCDSQDMRREDQTRGFSNFGIPPTHSHWFVFGRSWEIFSGSEPSKLEKPHRHNHHEGCEDKWVFVLPRIPSNR